MKKLYHTYCFASIFLLCQYSFAQQLKDTIALHEVSIIDYRSKQTAKNFAELKIDSATRSVFLTSGMSQLLLQQNACLVKSYGPANIASLSIRGSTAPQTAVLWNGMNINNAMLGMNDISLLPVGFFNSISLQKGALSGYWGSGAMAGVLNLRSNARAEKGISVLASTSYSSMKNISQWMSVNFSSGKWSSATRVLGENSKNQYTYYVNDSSVRTQTHAERKQYALMQDINYQFKAGQQFGMHAWLQDAQRQVPNTLSGANQEAMQRDKIFRAMLDWKLNRNKYSVTARTAFFNEVMIYNDQAIGISSNNSFKTYLADIETQWYLPKGFVVTGGSTNSISVGSSEAYNGTQQLSRLAFYQDISWKKNRVSASVYGREELFNLQTFVPTGGFTTSLNIFKWLAWKMNAGTVFRYPTLNDLYWNPGGNLNLKPEQGHSEETSLQGGHQLKNIYISFTGTVFSRTIQNWIMWLPGKNGIWSPQNILQVWSRGGETSSEISFKRKNFKTSVHVITNYVLSTPVQTFLVGDESKGKQIPYVPMYSGSGIFSLEYKNWMLRIAYVYTGYRYLTSDNYDYLLPYSVLDVRIARTLAYKNLVLNVFVEGNNLLNENYQSVSQYGMPLRNFKAGIIAQFQKNKPGSLKNKN